MLVSRYKVVSDVVWDRDTDAEIRLVLSTRTLQTLVVAARTWDLVEAGKLDEIPPAALRTLREAEVLLDDVERDELHEMLARSRRAIAGSTTLYECIQPTAACQLGCTYCGQEHTGTRLSEEDQDVLVERIDSRLAGCELLEIGWFGSEPLLGLDVIRRLTPRLRAVAARHGCRYTARIVTNGLALTPAVAEELANELGVAEVEITLDGSAECHDRRRHTKGGHATFARIFSQLRAAAAREDLAIRWIVRCNVDRDNAASVPELVEMLVEAGLQRRVGVYFAPIHDWGNTASQRSLTRDEYASVETDWLALLALRGFDVPFLPRAKPIVCMAVNPRSELTDPAGQIFNCTEVSLVPAYGTPNLYSIGRRKTERSSAAAAQLGQFLDDVAQGRFDCSGCPMLPVCGGACPKQWHDGHVPCPSAKLNLKERLVLAWAFAKRAAAVAA